MASLLVTLGTNGSKDWVETPDGQKFALGPVSALTLVSKLTPNSRVAQKALDEFLKTGEALLSVDDDHMWSLLAPRRSRWAATPFMSRDQGGLSLMKANLSKTSEDLATIKHVVGHLNKLAAQGKRDTKAIQHLIKLASTIEPLEVKTAPASVEVPSNLSFDVYEANMKLARGILDKAEQTALTIDRLATKGKKFDVHRARAAVATVTTKVASICSTTELTESWVRDDLRKLAARNDEIHGLFHSHEE